MVKNELAKLKNEMESYFNIKITDEAIWNAIELHKKKRDLQRELYNLRRKEFPLVSGAEAHAVMVAGTAMPIK